MKINLQLVSQMQAKYKELNKDGGTDSLAAYFSCLPFAAGLWLGNSIIGCFKMPKRLTYSETRNVFPLLARHGGGEAGVGGCINTHAGTID